MMGSSGIMEPSKSSSSSSSMNESSSTSKRSSDISSMKPEPQVKQQRSWDSARAVVLAWHSWHQKLALLSPEDDPPAKGPDPEAPADDDIFLSKVQSVHKRRCQSGKLKNSSAQKQGDKGQFSSGTGARTRQRPFSFSLKTRQGGCCKRKEGKAVSRTGPSARILIDVGLDF